MDAGSFLRTLSNHDGNVTRKYKFALLPLLGDYSNSPNLYIVAALSSNRTVENGVSIEAEKEKFTVAC